MAEDDIYGNRKKYERFKNNLGEQILLPSERSPGRGNAGRYWCKSTLNLQYFRKLFSHFEARDISYVRRNRIIQSMRLLCHLVEKDLSGCTRDDINQVVAAMHGIYRTYKSKQTFIADVKYIFKVVAPELDDKGRPDDTIFPYAVRHLSEKLDRSIQKLRKDKLTMDEFERLVNYFSGEPRIQAYLALSLESLARPQELLYRTIGNVELHDNYAKIYLTDHGKEGPGLLQCIDSYPYLLKWLDAHPLKNDKNAFLFVNLGRTNRFGQLKPANINKLIRAACRALCIDKPITCYSLKRNGVTMRRLRGESDMDIQHAARWTSAKQLKTYDMSSQEEAFRRELEKRGLVPTASGKRVEPKKCEFCNALSGFGEIVCRICRRPLDRLAIRDEAEKSEHAKGELSAAVQKLQAESAILRTKLEKRERIDAFLNTLMQNKKLKQAFLSTVREENLEEALLQL